MDTTPSTAHPGSRKGRPNYPTDFKLRLAQQACEPGVSVPRLACKHGIKANLLFNWRSHYRAGLLSSVPAAPLLVPVTASVLVEFGRG